MANNWLQLVTLAIAIVGAVLGVLNTWRAFSQDRVRLVIKPVYATLVPSGEECLSISIRNLSTFAITVTHIGFTMQGTDRHLQLLPLFLQPAGQLPVRLEPRTAFTAFAAPGATEVAGMGRADKVYVSTACGQRMLGKRDELAAALHNLSLGR